MTDAAVIALVFIGAAAVLAVVISALFAVYYLARLTEQVRELVDLASYDPTGMTIPGSLDEAE